MAEGSGGAKLLISWWMGSRKEGKGASDHLPTAHSAPCDWIGFPKPLPTPQYRQLWGNILELNYNSFAECWDHSCVPEVCRDVHVHVCLHPCVYVDESVYTCICTHASICTLIPMHMPECVCVSMHAHVRVRVSVSTCWRVSASGA